MTAWHSRKTLVGCAGLAALAAVLVPTVSSSAAAATATSRPPLSALEVVAGQVATYAAKDTSTFAGVFVDQSTRTVHVEVTTSPRPLTAALERQVADPAAVKVDHVAHSLAQLTATARQIAAGSGGSQVQKVAVDAKTDGLTVGLKPGSSPETQATMKSRYKGIPIDFQYLRVLSASGNAQYQAGPPWMTGMELYKLFYQSGGLYYTECTAGFNVINPSTGRTYVTTAAHCFNPGDTILHSTGSISQQVGTVSASAGFGTIVDTELVSPSVAETPNTVIVGNSTEENVTGYYPITNVGTSLCESGIATGQVCGNVVQSTDTTVCYSSGCFYNQEETYNPNVAEVVYYGDSGGPVYTYNGTGSVTAAGNISGFEETCNASGNDCSLDGIMFFTPIQNMQHTLGVVP